MVTYAKNHQKVHQAALQTQPPLFPALMPPVVFLNAKNCVVGSRMLGPSRRPKLRRYAGCMYFVLNHYTDKYLIWHLN